MVEKAKKCVTNNILFSENAFIVKEEFEDNYQDDKMSISETTVTESIYCSRDVRIEQYGISTVDDIKIESSCEIRGNNTINDNVKREDGVFSANDIKLELGSGLLFCNNCQEISQDYCTKCEMLVHILNPNTQEFTHNTENEEVPEDIVQIKQLFGRLGIFTLKVIPKGVKFGPFTGLSTFGYYWRLKGGRFVVDKDKPKFLNWMRHINPARNISEQNLQAFQCNNNLYYRCTREIQVDEELLVYFGEEYDESLNEDFEVNFMPPVEEDRKEVFGCTFCCLGFRSKTHLGDHKIICSNKVKGEKFSIEELMHCPFCKIYLDKKEYFEYHMFYCAERTERKSVPLKPDNQMIETNGSRTQRRHKYQCAHCKYKTTHKSDLESHANQHCSVKRYKCGMCTKRFKMKGCLKSHVEKIHVDVDRKEVENSFRSEYAQARTKEEHSKKVHYDLSREAQQFECSECEFRTKYRHRLKSHTEAKHLKEFRYKCATCEYEANQRRHLEMHMRAKHLEEIDYEYETNWKKDLENRIKWKHECGICEFKTNWKKNFENHTKTKHLKEFDYECASCEYKCNKKPHLERHIRTKHLQEFDYKCDSCEYQSNQKTNLERHRKTKHLNQFNYKCETCGYKTNYKTDLEKHTKSRHLKEFLYVCEICRYKTNQKSRLELHEKTKHLKVFNYKCEMCEYKTNRRNDLENHMKSKHVK